MNVLEELFIHWSRFTPESRRIALAFLESLKASERTQELQAPQIAALDGYVRKIVPTIENQ